ncbi:uncharacterized protein METZ01_LOCUS258171 [marine metagenome]|uniref:Uncharacterized protein n=1 Tax=marine metagenome TaxID=408172 RepID=A0A382J1P0_9ZZZZ
MAFRVSRVPIGGVWSPGDDNLVGSVRPMIIDRWQDTAKVERINTWLKSVETW